MSREQPCPDHGGTGTKKRCPPCKKERQCRYRQKNRDKLTERQRRYRQENREKDAEQQRRYQQENRDKIAEYQRRYRQENRDYLTARDSKREAAKNRASKYLATNNRKPWTPQEVAKMHRLRRQGLTNYEIAVELGRTHRAVRARITEENARH